jgi:hypothetical protein
MLHVVDETMQPEFVGLWLREPATHSTRDGMVIASRDRHCDALLATDAEYRDDPCRRGESRIRPQCQSMPNNVGDHKNRPYNHCDTLISNARRSTSPAISALV